MRAVCTFLAAAALTACSGGGDTNDGGTDASDAFVVDELTALDCMCPDVAPPKTITVLNAKGTALASFFADQAGNSAPYAVVTGNLTNLSGAIAVAADGQHNLYVATQLALLVFPQGSNGNVAPARTIAGTNALANTDVFAGITVASDGTIYAAAELASGTTRSPKIEVFAPNANGNVAPVRTIGGASSTMTAVLSMASTASQIAVADASQYALFFDAQANGDVPPQRSIKTTAGLAVQIALGVAADVWIADWNFSTSSAVHWATGAVGTTPPDGSIAGPSTKITAIGGIAVDIDATYVVNADPAGPSILTYPGNTTGDVPPIRQISGASTTLSGDASQGPMPLVVY